MEMLNTREVSALLHLSQRRIWDLCKLGVIPSIKLRGQVMIPRQAFDTWQRQQVKAALARTREVKRARAS